jgi:hypothetical protein
MRALPRAKPTRCHVARSGMARPWRAALSPRDMRRAVAARSSPRALAHCFAARSLARGSVESMPGGRVLVRERAHGLGDALAHLDGGLLRERQRHDALGQHALLRPHFRVAQPADEVEVQRGEGFCLSGAGAGAQEGVLREREERGAVGHRGLRSVNPQRARREWLVTKYVTSLVAQRSSRPRSMRQSDWALQNSQSRGRGAKTPWRTGSTARRTASPSAPRP